MPAVPRNNDQKTPSPSQARDPVPPARGDQESTHNKHNDGGQPGHKPQKHTPEEEGK